tara:strand:- start:4052 stop:5038 length:987 start_codon:yes stop_codon:yes gene_type:complete
MLELRKSIRMNRRSSLRAIAAGALAAGGIAAAPRKAQIAITFDLEMSRNFPKWEDTKWDYEKGKLDAATKEYTVGAARRIKEAGGVLHGFVVGQVLEQENVEWLKKLVADGHPMDNHSYDHVRVTAKLLEEVQFRFRRAPWLISGKDPKEVIQENIELCSAAMSKRLGVKPTGFRTPGGFRYGLSERPDLQDMFKQLGFKWISSKYARHLNGPKPDTKIYESIVAAQRESQPFRYSNGLLEIPMSPISDIGAFRNGRWKLEWFLEAVHLSIEWAVANRAVFDFLAHPSCLGVVDPEFKTIDLICKMVRDAGNKAELTDLHRIAAATPQ